MINLLLGFVIEHSAWLHSSYKDTYSSQLSLLSQVIYYDIRTWAA